MASPEDRPTTPEDLLLAAELSDERAQRLLASYGFRDPAGADQHLQLMAADLPTRLALGRMADLLLDAFRAAPDPDGALVGFSRYLATRTPPRSFLGYLREDPKALQVLTHVLGASPFLGEILIRNPEYFHWLLQQLDRPSPDLVDYREELAALLEHAAHPDRQLDALKRFRRREILRIATRDLVGKETVASATEQLSNLVDIIADAALGIVSRRVCEAAGLERVPGSFVVIGVGKLGGSELNYSSDIDLVYVYEPSDPRREDEAHAIFQKLARKLTDALSGHTAESYLYRVDLRLRPMGRRGNPAYSLAQCTQYYESLGETFERFALIKARPIAGDLDLGRRFVEMVRPVVYRKYLDHAAIEELARYKARVDRETPRAGAVRNVKTGPGGIREIELFVQVFQLIYGATYPTLQQPNTLRALRALEEGGFIDTSVRQTLTVAYEFLRSVEHRLQIVLERQTHSLSTRDAELEITARRMGFERAERLLAELQAHRDRVHAIYANLLDHKTDAAEYHARQFFRLLSGELSDADATEYLGRYRLRDAAEALRLIRALDQVPTLAHSRSSLRNLLANLLAVLMVDLERTVEPTRVLNRFERVVTGTGAAAALFRSLLENDDLRAALITVLDGGDFFAERLARHPEMLDFLVGPTVDRAALSTVLRAAFEPLGAATAGSDKRAAELRRLKTVEELKVLIEWLQQGDLDQLQDKLSLIADCVVQHVTAWETEHPAPSTLHPPEGWAVVALGKLGGRELSVHSDLDLVFLYRGDPQDAKTFARYQGFVHRVHDLLERPTAEGIVYRLDTRLRPEGRKGALACPLVAFERYLQSRAEIWERLAWTRCRFLAGDAQLAAEAARAVGDFVYGPWNPAIPAYVGHIRARMERELAREDAGRLDFKVGMGGLADIDFMLQLVQIREGHDRDELRLSGTRQLLATEFSSAFLTRTEQTWLASAHEFLRTLELVVRLAADAPVGWFSTDPAQLELMGRRLGLPPPAGDHLLKRYREVTTEVRGIYSRVLQRLESI